MTQSRNWRDVVFSDTAILILLALVPLVLHILTNHQYGFHRDELAMLDDARYLDWGYVAYPPVTPFIARLALELFGPSLVGVRFFSALAPSIVIVLSGLMTRDLGGSRMAQIVSAVAVAVAPASLIAGTIFMYVSFDYLWWALVAYFTVRLLKTEDPRWWLGIGAAIGLGMMTKFTMGFFAVGVVGGVLLTKTRRHLISPWLWAGVALSLLIFLPNLIWQIQHNFISLEFLGSIHARDVNEGRAESFLLDQIILNTSTLTAPLWLAGLYFYLFKPSGQRFRALGWMYLITLAVFLIVQGRGYYLAPIYPMLIAAGAVVWDGWHEVFSGWKAHALAVTTWSALTLGGLIAAVLALPIAPVNSDLWKLADGAHEIYREELGWQEMTETVANIYASLPNEEKALTGIFVGNYGEAGAINLYGARYGLPKVISGINSYWLRGYGNPPPQTLIVLGFQQKDVNAMFESCTFAARITNRYQVTNEESADYPGIFVCRKLRQPWQDFWKRHLHFG